MTDIARAARLLGASMRLTRLIVADDVPGTWWIKDPITEHAQRHYEEHGSLPRWWRYTAGLDCPFCIGLWIAAGAVIVDELAGQARWWRVVTTALTLNEAAAHLGSRLGDVADDDDDNGESGA